MGSGEASRRVRATRSSKQLCASHHSSTAIMSDEEFYEEEEVEEEYEEEEEEEEYEEEVQTNPDERKSVRSAMSEGDGNFLKARQEAKKGELDEQLREYINEWRKQRAKEEEELKRLKEKQAKRKEIRAEQEKKLAQQKKEEEERLRKEEAEKKAKEAEKKRQAMMQAQKEKQSAGGPGKSGAKKNDSGMSNVQDARREMTKTKEQLEEEKKISLSIRIKPLELDGMDSDTLKSKASELWETIVRLETEKYDLEERQKRQDYDLKELKERQRQQNKQKAIKLGLDPEALTGKYPPKIRMYSKYERRTDTRTYDDRRKLYEGGWDVLYAELLEKTWKEKMDDWGKRPKAKLPKWFGERPGKKPGDPESPDDEDEGPAEAPPGAEEEEEEEEEDEEEEEEEEE